MRYANLEATAELGKDGLWGVKVIDGRSGAVWWHTVCETQEDAEASIVSLFESEAIIALQHTFDKISMESKQKEHENDKLKAT